MEKNSLTISEELRFAKGPYGIAATQEALDYYRQEQPKYCTWEKIKSDDKIAIFFDTNFYLDLYELSLKERKEILDFFKANKKRIFITAQIEKEFISHRFDAIRSLRKKMDSLSSIFATKSTELRKCFDKQSKELNDFVRSSVIRNDMPETYQVYVQMQQVIEQLRVNENQWERYKQLEQDLLACLEKERQKTIITDDLEYNDDILTAISSFPILPSLSPEEIAFIKNSYDLNLQDYNNCKKEQEKKTILSFPGCGDRKKFEDENRDPYGDYIIYHEMLKFMATEKRDIVFITKDTSKSDWVDSFKKPFIHYIVNSYRYTGKMMFIIPAKNLFRNKEIDDDFERRFVDGDTEKGNSQQQLNSEQNLLSVESNE